MSKEQRQRVDALLRQPHAAPPTSIARVRAGFAATMAGMHVPAGIRTTATTLGTVPALLVEPVTARAGGTILYFHGGAFVAGSPETALTLTGTLVAGTGTRAFSLDYRLAPEHPFPAAIHDAVAAYRALLDGGEDPATIAFAGDSAGGNLAVTTCLAARDAGLPMPAAIVAFSPTLDSTHSGDSMDTRAGIDPMFTRELLRQPDALYRAGQDPEQPLLSPALHADLGGFPPILLQAGGNEVLLDDATRFAARARDAGVSVVLDITADVPHVFQSFAAVLDEADEALERAVLFLRQRLAG